MPTVTSLRAGCHDSGVATTPPLTGSPSSNAGEDRPNGPAGGAVRTCDSTAYGETLSADMVTQSETTPEAGARERAALYQVPTEPVCRSIAAWPTA